MEEKNKEIDEDGSIVDKKLQNQIQEGIDQELIERITQDILAMNEELKKIPNFLNQEGDIFPKCRLEQVLPLLKINLN